LLEAIRLRAKFGGNHLTGLRPHSLGLALICLSVLFAIRSFWQPGIANDGDMLMAVYRVFELDQSWHGRVLFPRIAQGLYFGYGGPLFQYYPPLASYVGMAFHWVGLGWIESTKAVFTLALFVAGLGSYIFAFWLFDDHRAAIVSALGYMLAPYLLLDIYERGALAEFVALALLPWVFWATHRLLRSPSRSWLWVTAILVALLLLAHNVTALFVAPLLAIYLLLLVWRTKAWDRLRTVSFALALGLGLSAFYWMPAIAESGFAQIEARMLSGGQDPITSTQLRSLGTLVQSALQAAYWGPTRYHPALWPVLLGGIALIGVAIRPTKQRYSLGILGGALILVLFLQLDISRPIWQAVPLMRFIQFPWRLLGFAAFCVTLLVASMFTSRKLAGLPGWIVATSLVFFIGWASLSNLDLGASPGWYQISNSEIGKQDIYERGRRGYPLYDDYTPAGMELGATEFAQSRRPGVPKPPYLVAPPSIGILSDGPERMDLRINAAQPFVLRLPRIFFPDWQIYVDGRVVPTGPTGPFGLVGASLAAGEHTVTARFEDTMLRGAMSALSAICLVILVIGAWRTPHARKLALVVTVLFAVFFALAIRQYGLGQPPYRPISYHANFEDEISLLGYHLDQADWHPGDTLHLRLYWFANRVPDNDYTVFVHIVRPDGSTAVAQSDGSPNLGYSQTSRWDSGEMVVDEHSIPLSADVAPGTYRVVVGMYRPVTVQNLRVSDAPNTLPGDRVILADIQVR